MTVSDSRSASPLLDILFEDDAVGRCLVAPDGSVLRANREWLRSTGFALDQVLGANIIDLFPGTRDLALAMHARARRGNHVEVPRHAQVLNGRETWWEGAIDPVPMEGGTGLLIAARESSPGDARALRSAEASADRFRTLAEGMPTMAWSSDAGGRTLFVNRAYREFFGVSEEDIRTRGWRPLVHPEDAPGYVDAFMKALASGSPFYAEARVRRADGEWRWIASFARPHFDEQGKLVSMTGSSPDITARKVVEDALRESEQRSARKATELQALLDAVPAGVFIARDLQAQRIEGNRAGIEMLRLAPGANVSKSAPPGDAPPYRVLREGHEVPAEDLPAQRAARGEEVRGWDFEVAFAGGETGHMLGYATPLRDSNGAPSGSVTVLVDITDRRRAEEDLKTANARLRDLAERLQVATQAAELGIYDYDIVSGSIGCDARVRDLWGVGPDEPITYDTFMAGVHPDDRTSTQAAVEAALDPRGGGRIRADYRVRSRGDGRVRWIATTGHVTFEGGRAVSLVGTVQDITSQRAMDEQVRKSEAQLRVLADAMPQLVWTAGPDGNVDYMNARHGGLHGAHKEASGEWTWVPDIHPDDVDATLAAWRRAVATGERYEMEQRVRVADGSYRWHLARAEPVRDEAGRVVRWYGTTTDIHEAKETQQALRDVDRRKTAFLAVLSHELRNPLAPIRNSLYLLDRAAPGSETFVRARQVIDRQTAHLGRLVDDLLDIARIKTGHVELKRERIDLRDLVRQAMDGARPSFDRAGLDLRIEHGLGPTWLDADPTRISQVISNLLHNAQKFTPAGGVVTVSLAAHGEEVELRVKDTGVGMEHGREHEMFEAFAQGDQGLARSQGGLGLGLSLVKMFVELHGGTVTATSEGKGRGTEFVITLPLAPTGAPRPGGGERAATPSRRVLVIEDNADGAQTLADVLALDGHVVQVATRGREGVAMAREHRPDVVLCDIGLPDIDGYEVARQVRAIPGLERVRLVALTGYAQAEDRERAKAAGFDAHLAKPPAPEVLARVLGSEG